MVNKEFGCFDVFLSVIIVPLIIIFCFNSNSFGWGYFWIIVELSLIIQQISFIKKQKRLINTQKTKTMQNIKNIIRNYNYNRLIVKNKILNLIRQNKISEAIELIKQETTISNPNKYLDKIKLTINEEELKINKALKLMRIPQLPINLSFKSSTYENYIKSKMPLEIKSKIDYKIQFNKFLAENILNYSLDHIDNFCFNNLKKSKLFDLPAPLEETEDFKIWEELKNEFYTEQENFNAEIYSLEKAYNSKDSKAVNKYIEEILNYSKYPDYIKKKFDIAYNNGNKMLLIDIELPNTDVLPKIKEAIYSNAKKEYTYKYYSEKELNANYEKLLYDIVLRNIYEIFLTDKGDFIENIILNGIVKYIDKADGHRKSICIISIQTNKDEFMNLNLKNVDVKACFKRLKGIIAPIDKGMLAIKPIMQLNRDDKRFIDAYEVMNSVNEGTNLASMDWQDFENLIRELFEKEFNQNDGEVKITQASKDGGVDAIAFDPDIIRGGKIIIQAKRYTNIVGVSAVRDLYGTLINEGANKGILITTSDYGSDAFDFAKDKPITLLNGNNLLHLLKKHGHKAYINIKEAKDFFKTS